MRDKKKIICVITCAIPILVVIILCVVLWTSGKTAAPDATPSPPASSAEPSTVVKPEIIIPDSESDVSSASGESEVASVPSIMLEEESGTERQTNIGNVPTDKNQVSLPNMEDPEDLKK